MRITPIHIQKTQTRSRFNIRREYFLIILGSLLLLSWSIHRYYYVRSLSLPDNLVTSGNTTKTISPIFIDIQGMPRLPIVEGGKINGVWTISHKAANHVQTSAVPGSAGNSIIYGHNTDAIFGKLITIPIGTVITITTSDGNHHRYKISETYEVDPWQTELLQNAVTEVLTIYTCSGWFDSKRYVVRAVPI